MPKYAPNGSMRLAIIMAFVSDTPAEYLSKFRVSMDLDNEVADHIGMLARGADAEGVAWLLAVGYVAGSLDHSPNLRDRLHRLVIGRPAPGRFTRASDPQLRGQVQTPARFGQ